MHPPVVSGVFLMSLFEWRFCVTTDVHHGGGVALRPAVTIWLPAGKAEHLVGISGMFVQKKRVSGHFLSPSLAS